MEPLVSVPSMLHAALDRAAGRAGGVLSHAGRRYGLVSGLTLLLGLATGAVLLAGRPWTGPLIAVATVTGLLVVSTLVGVAQARRMTRLRQHALRDAEDTGIADRLSRAARGATLLRAGIGALSLALIALGALLTG